MLASPVKYHYSHRFFTYSVSRETGVPRWFVRFLVLSGRPHRSAATRSEDSVRRGV